MKNLKKVLSLVLACATALTVMAGAAFTDQADIKSTEAVDMLNQLGVIAGYTDGSYKPTATVTRAEMAKMIYVARTGNTDASAYANISTTFTDIKGHWAAGYIKYCQTNGIIAGKSAKIFDPDATVTGTEAAKMLLITQGYQAAKAGLVGSSWATNTLSLADENNLLDDVDADVSAALPRQYAAQIIYNTLSAYRVKWSDDANAFDSVGTTNKDTVGYKFLKLCTNVGTVGTLSGKNLSISIDTTATNYDSNGNFNSLATDYSADLGEKVKVMFKDGDHSKVLGVYATSDNVVYNVNASGVEADGAKVKFGGTSYTLDTTYNSTASVHAFYIDVDGNSSEAYLTSTGVLHNVEGTALNAAPYSHGFDGLENTADSIKFVDSDNNGKLDTAIITQKVAGSVSYVSSSKVIVSGHSSSFDPSEDVVATGLTTDDWAVLSYNRYKEANQVDKADILTGATLSAIKTGTNNDSVSYTKYDINGTWYNQAVANGYTDINTANPSCTVTAVVVGGVVFKIKRTSSSTTGSLSDVALVVSKDSTLSGKQVKLQFFDDTTKVVTVDDDSSTSYDALVAGSVYEYSTASSGDYDFTSLVTTSDYYGDYTYLGAGTIGTNGTAITGNVTIGSTTYSVADTADVILYTASGDTKVITGKQLKAMGTAKLANTTAIASFKASVNGLDKIGALAVVATTTSNVTTSSSDNYAYIVSDAAKSGSNQITYTIWNGSENINVTQTGTTSTSTYVQGKVVGYSSIDSNNVIKDATILTSSDLTKTYLSAVSDDKATIQTAAIVNGGATSTQLDVDSSTKVIYVDAGNDTDSSIGVANGTLRKADKDTNGAYINNVLVIGDADNDAVLVVIDVTNDISDAAY